METPTEQRWKEKFEGWLARVSRPQPDGHAFRYTPNEEVNWTPLRRPVSACHVALVTSAGVHLRSQEPFGLVAEMGDPTCREIPAGVPPRDLMITHGHYDHTDADEDVNCIFPLERLQELQADGLVGGVAPSHFGFMGYTPDPREVVRQAGQRIAERLREDGVNVAVLSGG